MNSKRLQAITGDLVTITHPTLELSNNATTSVTVVSKGITYHVTSTSPDSAHDHNVVTGEYTLLGRPLRVRESVDNLDLGASAVRYENLWEGKSGTLLLNTHDRHDEGLDLLGLLSPEETPLGVKVTAKGGVQVASPPTLLFEAKPLGVLQISPLTPAGLAMLPDWQGTSVAGGELFAANVSRTVPYLMLITKSARVDILLLDRSDLDATATLASELTVDWTR